MAYHQFVAYYVATTPNIQIISYLMGYVMTNYDLVRW